MSAKRSFSPYWPSAAKREQRVEDVKEAILKATNCLDLASARIEDLAMAAALTAGKNARAIEAIRQHLKASAKLPEGFSLNLGDE